MITDEITELPETWLPGSLPPMFTPSVIPEANDFNCVDGICVPVPDGTGEFSSLEACQAACFPPPPESWDCVDGECVDPGDGTGEFADLATCEENCSLSPPCPSTTLVCDSISATKTKCAGFSEFTFGTGIKYTKKTVETHMVSSRSDEHGTSDSGNLTFIDVYTYDLTNCHIVCESSFMGSRTVYIWNGSMYVPCFTCAPIGRVCGSSTTVQHTYTGVNDNCPVDFGGTSTNSDVGVGPVTYPSNACLNPPAGGTSLTTPTTFAYDVPCISNCTGGYIHATLSDEYTDDVLKSSAIAALPPFAGVYGCDEDRDEVGQGCLCSSSANFNVGKTQYSLTRVKFKFTLSAAAPAGMVVEWDEVFTPENGDPPTTEHQAWVLAGGELEIGPFDLDEPDTDGTKSIENVEATCD